MCPGRVEGRILVAGVWKVSFGEERVRDDDLSNRSEGLLVRGGCCPPRKLRSELEGKLGISRRVDADPWET